VITGPTAPFWSSDGQWALLLPALLALVLSALIGIEREVRAKSAGLRTHTLVGLGAAVFMIVSKYGFGDLTHVAGVSIDPSRIAAQVVSGIGFIGGGLIFVRRDIVRGPTTAATVWLAAAATWRRWPRRSRSFPASGRRAPEPRTRSTRREPQRPPGCTSPDSEARITAWIRSRSPSFASGGRLTNCSRSRRTTLGASRASPAAIVRTPCARSAGATSSTRKPLAPARVAS
jgi:hypothetical protein